MIPPPARPRPFTAAAIQTLAVLGDLEANIGIVEHAVGEAVARGADLVVLPECMNTGYLFDDAGHARELAETLDGRYVSALSALASQHRIHLASGMTELGPDGTSVFNSAVLLDDGGDLVAHYQKQFLATHDQNWFSVGTTGYPVVETALGRLGLLICFDGRIPEIARALAVGGVDVVIDMANFFAMDQADLWVPARAYENGIWIVAATKDGVERSIHYPGGAMIAAPDGSVLDRADTGTHSMAIAEIDPMAARDKRWVGDGDRLRDRRPAAYAILGTDHAATPAASLEDEPVVPAQLTSVLAAVQVHALDAPGSLDDAVDMVSHAAALGVQLAVLPQAFAYPTGSPSASSVRASAYVQHKARARIQDIAARHDCVVVLPIVEERDGDVWHRAIVLGPLGELGSQGQVHRNPSLGAGKPTADAFSVIETPVGRLGVLVGYDGMFPESARVLALEGAEILAWCSAWDDERARNLLTVTKAEDNRCYLVCCNRTDAGFPGGSLIVDPTGFPSPDIQRTVPPDDRHGAVIPRYAQRSLTRVKEIIPGVHVLANRRTEHYGTLINEAPVLTGGC